MKAQKRLTPEQWELVRRIYEYDIDNPSLEISARRAGVLMGFDPPSRQAVWNRWKVEGWQRQGSMAGIAEAAQRKADKLTPLKEPGVSGSSPPLYSPAPVQILPAQQDAPLSDGERIEGVQQGDYQYAQQARQDAEDKRAELLARHRADWLKIGVLRKEAMDMREEDPKAAMERARLAKTLADTLKVEQDGERRAWGIDDIPALPNFSIMSDEELKAIASGKFLTN